MRELSENLSNHAGIYIILNIVDCKVYVGQASKFNNRDHIWELEHGRDNSNLQSEYDNSELGREFVYFVAAYFENNAKSKELDFYERLYMTLLEDFGYELYNINIPRSERTIQKLEAKAKNIEIEVKDEYARAKDKIIDDFKVRFQKCPKELVGLSLAERKNALEYYINHRLDYKNRDTGRDFEGDRFFFNRERICNILGSKEISICSLNIDEMFFSKAGNYIREGIDQILNYEMDSINTHNYCLWTFASNAVKTETIRSYCAKRQENNIDTYVLFSYTPSNVYASAEPYRHSCFRKKYAQKLSEAELKFLNFHKGKDGHYCIPEDIDCTAANNKSAGAFVIQELFLIKECVNEKLYDNYKAVKEDGVYDIKAGGYQRSTYYIRKFNDNNDMFELPKHRSFCFMGKLAAPYIIKLETE